ncbi:MAG: molecular chaperone TorD family protein [Dehalococcoidia bacterium]|nr:molecular chaperone TorD family protein [Dehalococcoidia bacterium]MDP6227807.1 molecular chaperone TorD family protein [Dehalococcoidia bacterium]MDP7085512.1 molecular chaperone TorD family protein [Dehalococcoidia bacterium]MDP7202023.1 molecular chaperone TorD family protein [Dehalococcoidia bacterium]HJN88311.1 molecular chaperone TorD family protein [Dehalococcoidia bacterium]
MRTVSEKLCPLESLTRLRQAAYRLFSQSLVYPDTERVETIGIVAGELARQSEPWAGFAFFREWDLFLDALAGLGPQQAAALQGEYVSSFQVSRPNVPCPIYESVYLAPEPAAAALLLAQLEIEYARAGLAASSSPRQAPDHVAVELEFMSFLCAREAEFWEAEDIRQARQFLKTERRFLRAHLNRWFPQFACGVNALNPDGVFASATRAAGAFIVHDGDLIDGLLLRFDAVREAP